MAYEPENIFFFTVFGDWHSNVLYGVAALKNQIRKATGAPDIYLHVGDFSIWGDAKYDTRFLSEIENELAIQDRELWFVDGNHENHPHLFNLPRDSRGLGIVSEHIFYIPRGYRWRWGEKTFLGLGGAGSIDRKLREEGVSWFSEEQITEEDFQRAIKLGPVDFMISHESPFLPDVNHNPFTPLPELQEYLKVSREYIAKTVAETKPKILVHGHHHWRYTKNFDTTMVVGLSLDGGEFDKNSIRFDLLDLEK